MKGLLAILSLGGGILLLANVKHVDTPREAPRVAAEVHGAPQLYGITKRQTFDALASEPAPTFEDTRRRMLAATWRYKVELELYEADSRVAARRQCALEAERLGRPVALWCAGTSYSRRLGPGG